MKPIIIQLRDGFAPVVVELHRPSIQVRLQTGPAQDTAIRSEIWLCNHERFVGLTLDEALSSLLIDPVRSYALAHAMSPAARSADIVISGHGRAIGVLGSAAVAMSRMESAMATA